MCTKCHIMAILFRVTIVVIKYHDQTNMGKRGLSDLHFYSIAHYQRDSGQPLKQERNLGAGADAETMKRCCLLTCIHGLLSLLSYTTQDQQPKYSTTHNGALPQQSLIK